MGFFQDLFFGAEETPKGLGRVGEAYDFASGLQTPGQGPDFQAQMGGLQGLLGQVGGGGLASASRDYMTSVLSGGGLNPYENQAFQNFAGARMGQLQDEFSGARASTYAQGLGRGSAGERMGANLMAQAERDIAGQGFQAQQAGLQRQYGISQFAPQMELQQQGMMAGLYGQQAGLGQQQYSNQLANFQAQLQQGGLMGNIAQSGVYQPQRGGGLLDVAATVGGTLLGTGGLGGLQQYQQQQPQYHTQSPYGF